MLSQEGNKLVYHYDAEELWIEPWGDNAVRVRATKTPGCRRRTGHFFRRGNAEVPLLFLQKERIW